MVISMEQYTLLRQEFLTIAKFHIKPSALNDLKNVYASAINSVRASDYINDIEGLVRILEKRGVIRYNNIKPLRHIARIHLTHSVINEKLDEYDDWLKSYTSKYPPQTNIYQLVNGECCSRNTTINHAPHTCNSNLISHPNDSNFCFRSDYKVSCGSPPVFIIENNLSCISLDKDPQSTEILFRNHFNCNDPKTMVRKDCKIRVVSYETYGVGDSKVKKLIDNVVSELPEEKERDKCLVSTSTTADLDETDAMLNTRLLTVPRSLEPEIISSSVNDDLPLYCPLKRSCSKDNFNTIRQSVKKFLEKKYVGILLIIIFIVIVLPMLLIVYGFSKNSGQYNHEPSAPSFQEIHSGQHEASNIPSVEHGSHSNHNRNIGFTATLPSMETFTNPQTLSDKEEKLQNLVFLRVSREMGKSWRDVARCLGVREYEINIIDERYDLSPDKAFEALKVFAAKSDVDYWRKNLMKALDKARRKDLRELVEDLVSRRYS